MAYTGVNKHTDNFNTVTYTGNATTGKAVTSGFATDFVWIKNRGTTDDHVFFDKLRGGTNYLYGNQNSAETTYSGQDVTFESTGVNVGSYQSINQNSANIVSWHWKASGSGSANTDGSINSTVTANQTAGFSVVSYTGTGSNATVGHGLGTAPTFIMVKNRPSASYGWYCYHKSLGATKSLYLHSNDSEVTSSDRWNNTAPTSSVFTVGTNGGTNGSGNAMIAYCFADKTGYCRTGKYQLNNNNDNAFIYTGFKPKFILIKNNDNVEDWYVLDTVRSTINPLSNANTDFLTPNNADTETTASGSANTAQIELVSNGFKIRSTNTSTGELSFGTRNYIYVAIGQSLVGSNNVPCTAR